MLADRVLVKGVGYHLEEGDADAIDAEGTRSKSNLPLGLDPALVQWRFRSGDDKVPLDQVVELLPGPFTEERKACLKKEKLPAIKAAVVQTMNDSMLLARPFHVYDKHVETKTRKKKTWPPTVLLQGQGEIMRRKLAVAARFSNQAHAHFLWIKQCDAEGCAKVYRKKQGAHQADTTQLAGFLQYNELEVEDGQKVVVVNTVQARQAGSASEDEIKRLLLFWFYLKHHASLSKANELPDMPVYGAAADVAGDLEATQVKLEEHAEQTRVEDAWDKAKDTKAKEDKAKEARQRATKTEKRARKANEKAKTTGKPKDKQKAGQAKKDAQQAKQAQKAAELAATLHALEGAKKNLKAQEASIKTKFKEKQEGLAQALTAFQDKLVKELQLGTCEGDRCGQKVKSKCTGPCTWQNKRDEIADKIQPLAYDIDADEHVATRVQELEQAEMREVEEEMERVSGEIAAAEAEAKQDTSGAEAAQAQGASGNAVPGAADAAAIEATDKAESKAKQDTSAEEGVSKATANAMVRVAGGGGPVRRLPVLGEEHVSGVSKGKWLSAESIYVALLWLLVSTGNQAKIGVAGPPPFPAPMPDDARVWHDWYSTVQNFNIVWFVGWPNANHWILVMVDKKAEKITYYDPFQQDRLTYVKEEVVPRLERALGEKCPTFPDENILPASHDGIPKQDDVHNCGVFVIKYAEREMREEADASHLLGRVALTDMTDQSACGEVRSALAALLASARTRIQAIHADMENNTFDPIFIQHHRNQVEAWLPGSIEFEKTRKPQPPKPAEVPVLGAENTNTRIRLHNIRTQRWRDRAGRWYEDICVQNDMGKRWSTSQGEVSKDDLWTSLGIGKNATGLIVQYEEGEETKAWGVVEYQQAEKRVDLAILCALDGLGRRMYAILREVAARVQGWEVEEYTLTPTFTHQYPDQAPPKLKAFYDEVLLRQDGWHPWYKEDGARVEKPFHYDYSFTNPAPSLDLTRP